MRGNLAEWAIKHKSIVYFFMMVIAVAGVFSFIRLGRMEDPDFTIRKMVVAAAWPGASAEEMAEQVTDKLERRLQDLPNLDYIKSYTEPGKTVIYVNLDDNLDAGLIRERWTEARNLVNDSKSELPSGVIGPQINDRFDDVYGSIYAVTGSDYSYEEKRKIAEDIRRRLLRLPDVKKIVLKGVQEEHIYVEVDQNKLAQLGADPQAVLAQIQQQSAMVPAGMVDTAVQNVRLQVNGQFASADEVKNLPIAVGSTTIRLGDVADVYRGYESPAAPLMYYNGEPAIGIALSMESGGNVLTLGENLDAELAKIKAELPEGIAIEQVADQPSVVRDSIHEFTSALFEAILIVLAASFLSLGMRSGVVVACCIPMIVCATFICMYIWDISLHIVSLGALIISLGILVDDAIIVVEMMLVKRNEGMGPLESASFAYKTCAFSMLSGTLITCAGFMPVGFAQGMVPEFTRSLFQVICAALLLSWAASVLVSPVLGYHLIQPERKGEAGKPSLLDRWTAVFYDRFYRILKGCLAKQKLVILGTVGIFILSVLAFPLIKMQFFPSSIRPEIIVDMTLPRGSSLEYTRQTAAQLEDLFYGDERIAHYASYVGEGAPRFILSFEPTLEKSSFVEFVVVTKSLEDRDSLYRDLETVYADQFPDARLNLRLIQKGPGEEYPVNLRVSGPDKAVVTAAAEQVQARMAARTDIRDPHLNWPETMPKAQVDIDWNKARLLQADTYAAAVDLQSKLSGLDVGELYDRDRTLPITFRLANGASHDLAALKSLPIHIGGGRYVPLEQLGTVTAVMEDGVLYRRDLMPTITIQARTVPDAPNESIVSDIYESVKDIRAALPYGYSIEIDGSAERSQISLAQLAEPVPYMVIAIMAILIFQLQKLRLMALAVLTAPLGIIGVVLAMLVFQQPIGFIAILGIIALSGMIIRNAIILLDQIEQHRKEGMTPYQAVVESTMLRFRPIMLTALTDVLGMIPLIANNFWRPMSVAFIGGLFVATALTLLVLPCLYAAAYKIKSE